MTTLGLKSFPATNMRSEDINAKVHAAQDLLSESSTTLEKVQSLATILKGIHPKLDAYAAQCSTYCAAIELASDGAIVELSASALPEETDEQKKRKKVLLLFIKSWNDLKSEVARVQAELDQGHSVSDSSFWKNVLVGAKGPIAVLTIVAIGIGVMSQTSVNITIQNNGCPTLYGSGVAVSIPGLVIPSAPLASGQSSVLTIPPITVTVDGTEASTLTLSSVGFYFPIQLSNTVTEITFDGVSLLGKKVDINLGDSRAHTLVLTCTQ
jgi:hypothetical protein